MHSSARIRLTAPDSITSYHISAIAMNDIYGIGLTESFTPLTIFQKFFIDLTLPYNCKRNETVTIPIRIFNYLNSKQAVTLSVVRDDTVFSVVMPAVNKWTGEF